MQRGPKTGRVKSARRTAATGSSLYRETDPAAVYDYLIDAGAEFHPTIGSLFAHQYARYWQMQEAVDKFGPVQQGSHMDRKSIEVQVQADSLAAVCKLASMIGINQVGALQDPADDPAESGPGLRLVG